MKTSKYLLTSLYMFVSFLILTQKGQAQDYILDKEGEIIFFSDAPIEEITATSHKAMGIIDTVKNQVAVSILMTSFEFKNQLMEEHFNENYVESEKYPKATFKGTLSEKIDYSTNGKYELSVTGDLYIHGKTKQTTSSIIIEINDTQIKANTKFMVALKDFKIKIPSIMFNKIAEEVEVTSNFTFKK